MKTVKSDSNKHKMKEEDYPPGLGKKYDNNNRNTDNFSIRNSRRYANNALLSLRWKTAGVPGIISHDFNHFVELLCD